MDQYVETGLTLHTDANVTVLTDSLFPFEADSAQSQPRLPVWISLLHAPQAGLGHVTVKDCLLDAVSPSHVQVQSAVQASAAEQRLSPRLWPGVDAPGPGTAALPLRGSGAGGGAGSLPVKRHHRWTCEPHANRRSGQRQGKSNGRYINTDSQTLPVCCGTSKCSLSLNSHNQIVLHCLDFSVITSHSNQIWQSYELWALASPLYIMDPH